jgi:hypothetical protein
MLLLCMLPGELERRAKLTGCLVFLLLPPPLPMLL